MSAFAAGIERWVALLQSLSNARRGSPDFQQSLESLRAAFSAELEAWLRATHPFAATPFGMPPQSAIPTAAAGIGDLRPIVDLINHWGRLQSQLATHWSTIAQAAAVKFMGQGDFPAVGGGLDDARKLFARWIDCAEEAYAETAHSEPFARLVADVINTAAALQLETRRIGQVWSRSAGIPTRQEIDVLTERIEQLEREARYRTKPRYRAKARGQTKARARTKAGPSRRPPGKGKRHR